MSPISIRKFLFLKFIRDDFTCTPKRLLSFLIKYAINNEKSKYKIQNTTGKSTKNFKFTPSSPNKLMNCALK